MQGGNEEEDEIFKKRLSTSGPLLEASRGTASSLLEKQVLDDIEKYQNTERRE